MNVFLLKEANEEDQTLKNNNDFNFYDKEIKENCHEVNVMGKAKAFQVNRVHFLETCFKVADEL